MRLRISSNVAIYAQLVKFRAFIMLELLLLVRDFQSFLPAVHRLATPLDHDEPIRCQHDILLNGSGLHQDKLILPFLEKVLHDSGDSK
jgi:hypothetical protein